MQNENVLGNRRAVETILHNRILGIAFPALLGATILVSLPAGYTHARPPGFHVEFNLPTSALAPRPVFKQYARLSISPRFTWTKPMKLMDRYRLETRSASWSRRTITLNKNFYINSSLVPASYDAPSLLKWRRQREVYAILRRSQSLLIGKNKQGRSGSLLSIKVPIRSKAVEALFGEGGAGLQVSGYRNISFAGTSSWTEGPSTARFRQSKFPTLRMDQRYRFDILGTIGSKIFVKVQQDSNVDIPLANRIELRFKGSEDDIIKTIEAGNTRLTLPNTQLLNYSSSIRGLFGIKAVAQVGPVNLTAIASQEKANTEQESIEALSSTQEVIVRDYEYLRYKIFDLAPGGKSDTQHFENVSDSIVDFKVYTSARSAQAYTATMYFDPRPGSLDSSEASQSGIEVLPLDLEDYTIDSDERTLILDRAFVRENQYMGIWLKMKRTDGTFYEIGDISSNNVTLKLIKLDRDDSSAVSWRYEWRNVYQFPSRLGIDFNNPDFSGIEIAVRKGLVGSELSGADVDHQSGLPYIQILGMDQYTAIGTGADGDADLNTALVDVQRRLLIMPHRRPFDTDTTYAFSNLGPGDTLNKRVPVIYGSNEALYQDGSLYYFLFKSSQRSSSIQLRGANIIGGSIAVLANGKKLIEGQDYRIMGNSITLISETALDPAARISVDYEVAPLFTVEKKTLIGTRLQFDGGKDFQFGTTLLFKSDKATTRKPKVGQETSKMFAIDMNFSGKLRSEAPAKLLDAIPGLKVRGASNLAITAEVARSYPNPNVDSDAFIDDFEGSREEYSLGLSREQWTIASRPESIVPLNSIRADLFWFNPQNGINRTQIWDEEVPGGFSSVFPLNLAFQFREKKIDTSVITDSTVYVFDTTLIDTNVVIPALNLDSFIVDTVVDTSIAPPDTMLDTTNYFYTIEDSSSVKFESTVLSVQPGKMTPESNWSGIMRSLSSGLRDQAEVELLEVRMRVWQDPSTSLTRGGFIHFDFGDISEDVFENRVLDQEDSNNNDIYDPDRNEDIGLDGMDDDAEREWFKDVLSVVGSVDPSGDNWPFAEDDRLETPWPFGFSADSMFVYSPEVVDRLKFVNGTQNNKDDLERRRPDTEDINTNRVVDLRNDYFSFKISLDQVNSDPNFFVEGSENTFGWRTYRIPLRDPKALDSKEGSPVWEDIRYVRIWMDGIPTPTGVEIASLELIRSVWKDSLIVDSLFASSSLASFKVAVINQAENADYVPPEGVTGSEDKINNIVETEQSLLLEYDNFHYSDTGLVRKRQPSVNYTGYRELRMFVHGDNDLTLEDSVRFAFRIGTDSLNFYEFRTILKAGWNPSNEVVMDFNELTRLKDSALLNTPKNRSIDTKEGHSLYRVFGNPTLRTIFYMAAVVTKVDIDSSLGPVSGEVWLDELRLTDVRKDVGTAARVGLNGSLGDLLNYGVSIDYRDAFYRGLANTVRGGSRQSLGSGESRLSVSTNMGINLGKILPPSLGASVPINVRYSRNTRTPLLVTAGNSDIILSPERRFDERSVTITKSFSVSESFNKRTRNPLYTVLLNKFRAGFNYTKSEAWSPTVPYRVSEGFDVRSSYNARLPVAPSLPIFFLFGKIPIIKKLSETRLNVFPSDINLSSNFKRSLSISVLDNKGSLRSTHTRDITTDFRTGVRLLSNLNSSFSMNVFSDMRDPSWTNISFNNFRLGREMRYRQNFSTDYSPTLFRFLTHKFTFGSSYTENRMQNVTADDEDDGLEPRNINQSVRYSASGTFDLQKFFGKAGGRPQRRQTMRQRLAQRSLARRSDSSKVDEKKDDEPAGPWIGSRAYGFTRNSLAKLTSFVQPFVLRLEKNQSLRKNGLRYRPGAAFRFGFSDDPDVPIARLTRQQTNQRNQGRSWSASTGVRLLRGGLSVKIDISENQSESHPSTGSSRKSIERTWPRLSISLRQLRGLEKIWGLNRIQGLVNSFIRRFTPKTGYSRRVSESVDLSTGFLSGRTVDTDRNPLLGVTVPIKKALSITASLSARNSLREDFNKINGALSRATREKGRSLKMNTQYRFSSPNGIRLPIFGKIKLRSTITFTISVIKKVTESEQALEDGIFELQSKRESFSVSTNITYSFSTQVSGGVSSRWIDTNDARSQRKTHTRELRMYAEMRF